MRATNKKERLVSMKKRVLSILLALVLVFCSIPLGVSAASYPIVILKSPDLKIYQGANIPLVFHYSPAYNNERIEIKILNSDNEVCATGDFDINNKYSSYSSLTLNWDTSNYSVGKYTINVRKFFYSFYDWREAPSDSNYTVNIIKPKSKVLQSNAFKGSATHYKKAVDEAVNAKSTVAKNAVSAWKRVYVKNVKNPFMIQLTELYLGEEAEKIALDENMFNVKGNANCQWVLMKFNIKNSGSSAIEASDLLSWTRAYLPSGEEATVIDTCTFGDLPHYDTVIAPGETKEAWFGYYMLKSQGMPLIKLDNGAYIYTNPLCAKDHSYSSSTSKYCRSCKYEPTPVSKLKVSLSTTSYVYNGNVKKPSVVVKTASGTKLSTSAYTVTYASGRKNVGKYKVTVKMKGAYSGTKTLYFTIKPPKTTIAKLTPAKTTIKAYVSRKTSQVSGYQIQYSTSKSFKSYKTKNITSYKTGSTTLTGVKGKTTYYVRVRTYKIVNGTKIYSSWTTAKKTKTK